MNILLITLAALIIIFLATLLIRTLIARPRPLPQADSAAVNFDREKAVSDMAALLSMKTVSSRDEALTDPAEFEKFYALLGELYPQVHAHCKLTKIGPAGLLYHWPGKDNSAPIVLMSHFDVVPADAESWEVPPFGGIVADGYVHGRGALDNKATLCGILNAAETLIADGHMPAQDIYFSFGGDEEIHGASAVAIVSWLEENGIRPAMVVDEGGMIAEGIFPGVSIPCALVGIAEKGVLDVEMSLESKGGHASTPPPHTILGEMAQAIRRIEKKPPKAELTSSVNAMFDTLGRHASFGYRLVFANLWCFLPVLKMMGRMKGGGLNAMLRTTRACTRMEGSKAFNILPTKVVAGLNIRLLGQTTMDAGVAQLKKSVKNDAIRFHVVSGSDPSPASRIDGPEYATLSRVIRSVWPEVPVSPWLMVAATDSRHFCRICPCVYRFLPIPVTDAERATVHGHNERIAVEKLYKVVEFYLRLMQEPLTASHN